MPTRIYIVNEKGKPDRLVEALTPAQAIKHVVSKTFSARPASAKEVAKLLSNGDIRPSVAGEESEDAQN